MSRKIYLDAPSLSDLEKRYVNKAISDGYVSTVGPFVPEFEEKFAEYLKRSPAVIASFGGRYLIRGGEKKAIEGPAVEERLVVLEFENMERAVACFNSPAYQVAKAYREDAAEMQLFAVEGYQACTC